MMIDLGTFENKSGALRLSDPCYPDDTWCAETVNCVTGTWEASIVKKHVPDWGDRVFELIARAKAQDGASTPWIEGGTLGVDSGQMGIFDEAYYDNRFKATKEDINKAWDEPMPNSSDFYKVCCGITLSETKAGVMSVGVVSSTGLGDGSYDYYTEENQKGEVTGVKIVFLTDEDFVEQGEWEELDELPRV